MAEYEKSMNSIFLNVYVNASFQQRMKFEEAAETKPVRNYSAILLRSTHTRCVTNKRCNITMKM